ncbi:helix-turn-helix domain-containing protein [Salmonella enterica]|nr:helix-turn-helix domain-containing protein [Salmonella enterica subsp. enterica serovar Oranienburg]EKJ5541482.1 helix-turn-helix domain-containing protein [Salmonella enterica]
METPAKKNHRVSLDDKKRETFLERLKELVRGRPLQQAADEWNVPKSTINNYFYRGSNPRTDVIERIAAKENVSAGWLIGDEENKTERNQKEILTTLPQQTSQEKHVACPYDVGAQVLLALWEALEPTEKARLNKLLLRKGAEFLTLLLDEDNLNLLQSVGDQRRGALMMMQLDPIRIREILPELRANADVAKPVHQSTVSEHKKDLA